MARKKEDPSQDVGKIEKPAEEPYDDFSASGEENEPRPKKVKKSKPVQESVELPMMVELVFTFSAVMLVLVDLVVVAISYSSGASIFDIFIRVLVATAGMGVLLWLFSWQFSTAALQGAMLLQREEMEKILAEARRHMEQTHSEEAAAAAADAQA